ncbi:MAG: sulfatase [Saprospiraceae bacterium]
MKNFILQLFCAICLYLSVSCEEQKAETTARPNILLAIADDVSFPHMGAYGTSWVKTPNFDEVAKKGILFQNAYTPNAKCAPSRSIILTGRNSWQLEEAANHFPFFPAKFKTVFEALKEHGYFTGHVAKGYAPGNPGTIDGKPRELVGKAYNAAKITPPTTGIGNFDYAANFAAFLQQREAGQPFCFWYGSLEPHRAYEYGTGQRLGGKAVTDLDSLFAFFPEEDSVRNDVLDYAFEIEYFDQQLGKMLTLLKENGELDNTIIIVTADNGMPFPRVKGQVYERSNHLPLAIMWGKGVKDPGRSVEEFVSFADFAPTLLDVAGIDPTASGMQAFEGKSLGDVFSNQRKNPYRDHMIVGKERHDIGRPNDLGYPVRGIVNKDYLFLINFKPDRWPGGDPVTGYLNCDGSPTKTAILHHRRYQNDTFYWDLSFGKRPEEELYHIATDPDCMTNLAGNPAHQVVQQALKEQLLSELKAQQDPRVLGNGDVFDQYLYSDEKTRDFYNRFMKGEPLISKAGWVNADDFEKE